MLLKPKTNQRIQNNIKQRYFRYQQCLMNSRTQHSQLMCFILQILHFLPTVCLFFRNQQYQHSILNKIFSFFIWSQIHTKLQISQMVILVIMALFDVIFISSAIYTFLGQKTNHFSKRLIIILLKFVIYFIVPFMQLHLSVITKSPIKKVDRFFQSLAIITLIFTISLSGLFLKLKIKPLRKNNLFWKFTNQYELERYFLNVVRTLVFFIDGITVANLIISLGLEYLLRLRITKYHQPEYLIQIENGSNLVLSAHLAVLCYKISNDTQISSKLLLCLLLLSLLKGIHDYYHENNKPLLFPLCKNSPYLFYDFYFKLHQRFHEKTTNDHDSNQKFYYTTLKQHSRRCKSQTCPLKYVCLMKKNIMPQVENFVSQVLSKNKYNSPDLQLLEQFWKLQRGKKFTFRQLQGRIDLQTQFIIFSIQNSETTKQVDSGADSFISQNNIQQVNSVFYDPLLNILRNFSQFYTQILKPKPKIQTITRVGEKIRNQVEIIQQLYMDLLKKKVITFKAIQLYIQFENYFLKCSKLSPQLLKKITIIQKNTRIEDIEQIYLPAINFYPQSNLIQDVNMQCLGFLRYSRFQFKTKYIYDIILPNFQVDSYFDLNQQQLQSSLMFIKKKQNQFVCGNIRINVKFLNNKRIFVLVFQKKKRQQGTNFILVNNKFEIIHMTTQIQNLKQKRHPQNITVLNWREIFQTHLKPHQRQLQLTKLIKVDLKQLDSILMCTLNKTLNQQYSVINLRIMKNLKDVVRQRRSNVAVRSGQSLLSVVKRQKFFFSYDMEDQKTLVLRGQHSHVANFEKKHSQTKTIDYFAHKMRTSVVDFTLIKNQHFAKGIKTYRLIGQDLYNVDLQDKQAYIMAFDDIKRSSSQHSNLGKNPVDVYIIALVIIISLILTGLSFYLLFSLQINMQTIDGDFTKINQINTFKMDFYRILAMLRDVASGLYQSIGRDWVPDVMQSYDNILLNQNKKMFSNNQVTMNYRDFLYMGNLNQLMQVILSDVFKLTHDFHNQIIQNIHSTSIQQLTEMIQNEDDLLQNRIVENLTQLGQLKNWLGIGTLVGILAFYILIFYFGFNLVATMKRNLNQLMMISDNQAREGMQNAQKLIYVIEMTKKNFQIDFKNLLPPRKRYRPRKKQKQIIVGPNLKFISLGSLGTLFLINIMFIIAFYIVLQSSFQEFKLMKSQGQTIISIYSDLCRQTNYIDHTSILNTTSIQQIRIELQNTQKHLDHLTFSQQTNKNIRTYFLYDSCPLIYQKNYVNLSSGITCQRSTPYYEVSSAFTIGLMVYFNRLHYQIINNITDTYAATGAYSSIFSKVFTEMSRSIKNDQSQILDSFIVEIQIWCISLNTVNLFYCFFAVCLSYYVKQKGKSVEKLIKFLNPRKQYQSANKNDQKVKNSQRYPNKQSIKQKPKRRLKRLSLLQNQLQT